TTIQTSPSLWSRLTALVPSCERMDCLLVRVGRSWPSRKPTTRQHAAALRPPKTSLITYILVQERERGLISRVPVSFRVTPPVPAALSPGSWKPVHLRSIRSPACLLSHLLTPTRHRVARLCHAFVCCPGLWPPSRP